MSRSSRTKGHGFERQICKMINQEMESAALPYSVSRDLSQYQTKDLGDIVGIPGFTIECKRYKEGSHPMKLVGASMPSSWQGQHTYSRL